MKIITRLILFNFNKNHLFVFTGLQKYFDANQNLMILMLFFGLSNTELFCDWQFFYGREFNRREYRRVYNKCFDASNFPEGKQNLTSFKIPSENFLQSSFKYAILYAENEIFRGEN